MIDFRTFSRTSRRVLVGWLMMLAGTVQAEFADTQGLRFQFAFDGVGVCPQVCDISGGGYQAIISNNVYGCRTTNAKCFSGFDTETSSVVVTNAVGGWTRDCTVVGWVRNLNLDSTKPHLLFRAGGRTEPYDGFQKDNSWQVSVDTNGAVVIGLQDWNAKTTNNVNTVLPVDWQSDVWYQVAVTVKAPKVGSLYEKDIAVYVTPQGCATVGEPVSRLEHSSNAGFGSSRNLIVGAARAGYHSPFKGGYLDGEIAGVTMFDRVLTTEELLHDVSTFQMTSHPIDAYADFHWNLNETGDLPVAVDATPNGINGITTGGVSGGDRAPQGTSYKGFASTSDKLYASGISFNKGESGDRKGRNELLLWVRRPEATAERTTLLAGSMNNPDAPGQSQPWRVSVGEDGAVSIAMQSWNGKVTRTTGEPYAWGKEWHLVSIRFDCPTLQLEVVKEGITNWANGVCNRIVVSTAPAAKTGGRMQVLAEAHIPVYNSLLPDVKNLVFGSAGSGFYKEFQPESVLGPKGRLGEILYKSSGWFDADYKNSLLSAYYVNPLGTMLIIR